MTSKTGKTIDHASEAERLLSHEMYLSAQAHATLALVEEQRTANLLLRAALSVAVNANGGGVTQALVDVVDGIDARLGLGGAS